MKRLLLCLLIIFLVPLLSPTKSDKTENINIGVQCVEARSGCCSWHGGVCGCDYSTDRIVCCDGTLSPSCRCSTY